MYVDVPAPRSASPPLNVDVEFVPETVRKPEIVDVACVDVALNANEVVVPYAVRSPDMVVDPMTERVVPGDVVPMPTLPVVLVITNLVVVAKYVSLRVANTRSPPGVVDAIQCLRSVPALGFERTSCGVDVDEI